MDLLLVCVMDDLMLQTSTSSCTLNYLIYSYENNIFITVSASRQTLGENLSDPASFFSIEKKTSGNLYKVSRLKYVLEK